MKLLPLTIRLLLRNNFLINYDLPGRFMIQLCINNKYETIFHVFDISRMLAETEGILCGISSGAAMAAALKIAKRRESKGKCMVVILPSTGERYISTELFSGIDT